jgi:hypothetical protein
MFQRRGVRATPAAMASYDRLRRSVASIDAAGRLRIPVEIATAAFWAAVHGVTSLRVTGGLASEERVAALVRDAMLERYTRPATTTAAKGGVARTGRRRGRAARAASPTGPEGARAGARAPRRERTR